VKQGGRYFLLHKVLSDVVVKQKVPSPLLHDNLLMVYKPVMLPLTIKDNLMVMN